MTNKIVNELPNTDCLTTGDLNEKDFWSAQCMQCASRCTTQNFEDLRQSFKFVYIKKSSLKFTVVTAFISFFLYELVRV